MNRIIFLIGIFLWITCSVAMSEDGKTTKNLQVQLTQYEEKVQQLEGKNNEIKNDLINRTIGIYQITNDRLNSHISYLSLIATIFGLIIAIGGAWIGYESIRSRRRAEEAIRSLEEAKKYVESKKDEFNELILNRLQEIDGEFQKLVGVLKEQLVSDINNATEEVKNLAEIKTQEIHGYSIQKQSEEALESINRRIAFFENIGIPDDPKILLSKAKFLDEKEMYDEAIELLEKLVKLDSKSSKGYWQLGWEYSKKGNREKSIENYKTCTELDSNDATAYNNMGVELDRLGRYEEALEAYEMTLSKGNGKALYHSNKAKVLQKVGKNDESVATYKKAITLFPSEENLYKELLDFLEKLERYGDMTEYFNLAINNLKEKSQVYNYAKATFLAEQNKGDEAIKIFTNLAEQNYKTSNCYLAIANIWLEQGKQEESIAVLDKAISMDSKNCDLYLKRAEVFLQNSNEQAFETVMRGFEHTKNEYYIHKSARLFSSKGDMVLAKKLYSIAVDICKNKLEEEKEESHFMNYYECLLITGHYDEAEDALNTYHGFIKSGGYLVVLKVLKLYEQFMRNVTVNIKNEANYFQSIALNDEIGWQFDDILNFMRIEASENNFKFLSAIANLLSKKINKDEFKKIVDDCTEMVIKTEQTTAGSAPL